MLPDPRDTEYVPWHRNRALCINCGFVADFHDGWSCFPTTSPCSYKNLSPKRRFYTADMVQEEVETLTSIPVVKQKKRPTPKTSPKKSEPNWKTWRDVNRKPHECACGIVRALCSYHKDDLFDLSGDLSYFSGRIHQD